MTRAAFFLYLILIKLFTENIPLKLFLRRVSQHHCQFQQMAA